MLHYISHHLTKIADDHTNSAKRHAKTWNEITRKATKEEKYRKSRKKKYSNEPNAHMKRTSKSLLTLIIMHVIPECSGRHACPASFPHAHRSYIFFFSINYKVENFAYTTSKNAVGWMVTGRKAVGCRCSHAERMTRQEEKQRQLLFYVNYVIKIKATDGRPNGATATTASSRHCVGRDGW